MVRRVLSTAIAAAAFAGVAYADGAKCTKDSHCPKETPCCSRAYCAIWESRSIMLTLVQYTATAVSALSALADAIL